MGNGDVTQRLTPSSFADPGDRAVLGVGLRSLAHCDYGFESCLVPSRLSLVSVVR